MSSVKAAIQALQTRLSTDTHGHVFAKNIIINIVTSSCNL